MVKDVPAALTRQIPTESTAIASMTLYNIHKNTTVNNTLLSLYVSACASV